MIKTFNVACHLCRKEKPVRYYIAQWQKVYMVPLPLPHCEACAKERNDLTLYSDWIAILDACDYAKGPSGNKLTRTPPSDKHDG